METIMNNAAPPGWAVGLTVPLAFLLAVASLGGLFLPTLYSAETRIHAAQAAGIDAGTLVVVVPVLAISAILALRRSLAPRLVWMGTLACIVYNSAGYAFGLHLNAMFLAYCGILGLSVYALAGSLQALPSAEMVRRFGPRTPVKVTAAVLLLMGAGTVFHWLNEMVPALVAGQMPQALRDSGSLTEPVAVLDLALMAPVSILAAILLLRGKSAGFVLGPMMLTFLALSGIELAPMGMAMELRGFKAGFALYAVAAGCGAGSTALLWLWLRTGNAETP